MSLTAESSLCLYQYITQAFVDRPTALSTYSAITQQYAQKNGPRVSFFASEAKSPEPELLLSVSEAYDRKPAKA